LGELFDIEKLAKKEKKEAKFTLEKYLYLTIYQYFCPNVLLTQ